MLSVIIPVYRNARSALELVADLVHQKLPGTISLEIVIVDDGSGNDTQQVLAPARSPFVRVITLSANVGRAGARNAGAAQARGRYLVFIDCDCRPANDSLLASHVELLDSGHIACCGPLVGSGSDFWKKYQNNASRRRAERHATGATYMGTTANFSVHADAFRRLGGFDIRYRTYGFEDRDLLIRLSRSGTIAWCSTAVMQHCGQPSLSELLAKMRQAGGQSAVLFSKDHPDAYRELGYAALDARLRPWLSPIGLLSRWIVNCAGRFAPWLDKKWMPYSVARIIVKLLSGLAYIQGSMGKTIRSPRHKP